MPSYENERYHLLHEMRTIRAKKRLGLQVAGERRHIIRTMVALRKVRPIRPQHEEELS
jgi:hypothetical protein